MRLLFFLFSFFLVLAPARAAWVLNSSPALTDTAISIEVSSQEYMSLLYQLTDGSWHVTSAFRSPDLGVDPMQVWDVSLTNGVSRVRNTVIGYAPVGAHVLTSSNTLVLGTQNGRLCQYDVVAGVTNFSTQGYDNVYYSGALGSDGHAYFGTYPNARVQSFDPATSTTKDWGMLDTNLVVAAYCFNIGADNNYIYGSVRIDGGPLNYYISIIRKSDTNKTVLWSGGQSAVAYVLSSTNGNWYILQSTNGSDKYWRMTNEVPVEVSLPSDLIPKHQRAGVNKDPAQWAADTGWDISADFTVTSASGSIPSATLGWKRTTETNWTSVVETNGWLVAPGLIDIIQPWTGSSLLWVANAYGPVGSFVPGGTTSVLGPYKGTSIYDVLQVSSTLTYLSGYHRETLRWNPASSWTRVPLLADYTSSSYNPYTVVTGLGKYHYYLAQGSNGRLHVGSLHSQDASGGELAWYDPSTGSTGSERTTFLSYGVRDLKPAEAATKLVYASDNQKVFVWDVATFAQLTNFTVLNGASLDKVVEYSSGNIMGVSGTNTVGFTTAGVQLWSNNIPSTAWGGTSPISESRHRLTLGPDNYVWLCAGGILRRINPADGSYANILTTTTNYNTVFDGVDAYLYGTTLVLKISNLLTNTGIVSTLNAATANVGTVVVQ